MLDDERACVHARAAPTAMAKFDWTDALNLTSQLADDEVAVRCVQRPLAMMHTTHRAHAGGGEHARRARAAAATKCARTASSG